MIRRAVLATLAVAALAAGCSSSSDGGSAGDAAQTRVAETAAKVGDLGDAVEVMAGAPAAADAGACGLDRTTLEAAVEMYIALVGDMPATQDDLVAEALLKEPSPRFEIGADGHVIPADGSPCT